MQSAEDAYVDVVSLTLANKNGASKNTSAVHNFFRRPDSRASRHTINPSHLIS